MSKNQGKQLTCVFRSYYKKTRANQKILFFSEFSLLYAFPVFLPYTEIGFEGLAITPKNLRTRYSLNCNQDSNAILTPGSGFLGLRKPTFRGHTGSIPRRTAHTCIGTNLLSSTKKRFTFGIDRFSGRDQATVPRDNIRAPYLAVFWLPDYNKNGFPEFWDQSQLRFDNSNSLDSIQHNYP